MTGVTIDHQGLEAYIPHRGLNILPDRVDIDDDWKHATSRTVVTSDDPRGRAVFARQDVDGSPVWNEPFIGELLALTGVSMLRPRLEPRHQVAVFSAIRRVVFLRPVPMDQEVIGHAWLVRERGDFAQYRASLEHGGEEVFTAEIMSGAATLAEIYGGPRAREADPFPAGTPAVEVPWKPAAMRFVDRLLTLDESAGTASAAYTYPADHPMVPGHFPGAPLMMGVTQYSAVIDAAWQVLAGRGDGDTVYRIDGTLVRPSGEEVMGVRDLRLRLEGGRPRLLATERIAFREVVRPGDHIRIDLRFAAVE